MEDHRTFPMWIMFAYSGWNASTYLGAEIKNPSKILPRSLSLWHRHRDNIISGLNMLYVMGSTLRR